jgi:hypothetical protein
MAEDWVKSRSFLLFNRSARVPPYREKTSIGKEPKALTKPRRNREWVSS